MSNMSTVISNMSNMSTVIGNMSNMSTVTRNIIHEHLHEIGHGECGDVLL